MEKTKYQLRHINIPQWMYADNRLSRLQICVLGFIYSYNSDLFFFSDASLAKMFNASDKGVSKAIKACKKYGYLSTLYKIKANGGKTRYVVLLRPESPSRGVPNPTAGGYKDNILKNNVNNGVFIKTQRAVKEENPIITYYFGKYRERTGVEHPFLKRKQLEKAISSLESFTYDWSLDGDGWETIIDKWFNLDIETDWNINHFLSVGENGEYNILNNRFYEELY